MAQCRVCHETYQDTLFETQKCDCGFSRTAEQMEAKRLMDEYQELVGDRPKPGKLRVIPEAKARRMVEIRNLLRPFIVAHEEMIYTGK